MRRQWVTTGVVLLSLLGLSEALSTGDFYPYGLPAGDTALNLQVLPTSYFLPTSSNCFTNLFGSPTNCSKLTIEIDVCLQDESASPEFQLVDGITFYGVKHRSLFVNQNGLISFGTEVPYFRNQELSGFDFSLIAPFYADVDTYNSDNPDIGNGYIFFREERTNTRLITGASKLIRRSFADADGFEALSLFIATWDEVGYYEGQADKRNSFQVVIASNQTTSYVALLYGQLAWIVSNGGKDTKPDAPAQAGFVSDDGRHQTLLGSGTDDVRNLATLTNTQMPGLFLFRVSGEAPIDPRSTQPPDPVYPDPDYPDGDDYIDEDEQILDANSIEETGEGSSYSPPVSLLGFTSSAYLLDVCPDWPAYRVALGSAIHIDTAYRTVPPATSVSGRVCQWLVSGW